MLLWKKLTEEQKNVVSEIKRSFGDEERHTYVQKTGFSASALGFGPGICPRRWVLAFRGANVIEHFSSVSKKKMSVGTAMHELIQNELSANPNLMIEIEKEIWHKDPALHGFIDGVITSTAGEIIPLEIKSSGEVAMAYRETSFNAAVYHKLQLLIYMHILGAKLGLFLYENRDDFRDLVIPLFMDDENQAYVDYLFAWMNDVRAEFDRGVIPNFFKNRRKNSKICGQCQFRAVCEETGEEETGIDLPLLEMPK